VTCVGARPHDCPVQASVPSDAPAGTSLTGSLDPRVWSPLSTRQFTVPARSHARWFCGSAAPHVTAGATHSYSEFVAATHSPGPAVGVVDDAI
jgi:hypothetical protein